MGEERLIPVPPRTRRTVAKLIEDRSVSWKRELEILDELPSTLGVVLWQDLRHVRDWVDSTAQQRALLFNPKPSPTTLARRRDARASAAEIADALDVLGRLKSSPMTMTSAQLGTACASVAEWAVARDFEQTAIEWAEVAALVDLENPRYANLAGRLTRNANEFDRSEVWFRRGIGLAREQGDVVEQVWGHLGLGRLFQEVGWVEGARKHLSRGSRLAWKEGPPSLAASAQHDLFVTLAARGHLTEALGRARRALLWYPKHHPRLPFFGADVALLFVFRRQYAAAARLLRVVLRTVEQPSARAAILGLAARAFAGAGEREEAAVLVRRSLKLLAKHPGMDAVVRWHLADAHRLSGAWSAAKVEARKALSVAVQKDDRETARLVRQLLGKIEAREESPTKRLEGEEAVFVRELTNRLTKWSPRRLKESPGPWGHKRVA